MSVGRSKAVDRPVLALVPFAFCRRYLTDRLLQRVLAYRMFPDNTRRMNINLQQAGGGLLLVPQFTLAADTNSGNRPNFTPAAEPAEGRRLFAYLVQQARLEMDDVATGIIGTNMKVSLVNDGPVTFWLQVSPAD